MREPQTLSAEERVPGGLFPERTRYIDYQSDPPGLPCASFSRWELQAAGGRQTAINS
jgi:hypothetical protein